jgi:Spondin_N
MAGRILATLTTIATIGAIAVGPAGASAPVATYEVTIENLTPGQAFTPPILAVHRASTGMFTVGQPASFAIKEIAENGNLGPMTTALGADRHVLGTSAATAPLLWGNSVTLTVTASEGANFLSFASMLICTNDGFTGLDALRLPKKVGDEVVVETAGYDAGTERNTEDYADIVPPCQSLHGVDVEPGTGQSNPALAEGGVIHHHAGIQEIADLTETPHAWSDPVAEVTVERIS